MLRVLSAVMLCLLFANNVSALDGLPMPQGGRYVVKDNNIVVINGKTMIQDASTRLISCGGKEVPALPSGIIVDYTLREPVSEPIPILDTVTEQCG